MGGLTGPLRDVDVLMHTVRDHRADIHDDDMSALSTFLSQVQQQEHHRLIEVLDDPRYRRLIDWKTALQQRTIAAAELTDAARPLAEVVAERAWRLSRRIAAHAEALDEHTPETRIHEVRIDAKKLRYLIHVTPAFYPAGELEHILRTLKKLQRVLGDFNDAHVQEKRLLEFGTRCALPAGRRRLADARPTGQQSRSRHEGLRTKVVDRIDRLRKGDMQSACRRAFKRVTAAEQAG